MFNHSIRTTALAAALLAVAALLVGLITVGTSGPAAADGDESPGSPVAFERLSAGGGTTCLIASTGTLRCWGNNTYGEAGAGDTVRRGDDPDEMGARIPAVDLGTGRTAAEVSVGGYSACAVLDNERLKCWGRNDSGQLGQGDVAHRGDGPGEMGDALAVVALGSGRTVESISVGEQHACALLDNARVKCFGLNTSGQLGQGDTASRGDGPSEMGGNLPQVALGTGRTATAIAAGTFHSCAILDNGTVKCWGSNTRGQLGLGDTANRGDGANEMGDSLPSVDLGTGRTATAISASTDRTCALLDNGTVKCWGYNALGGLGVGDTNDRGDGPGEMGDALPAVPLGTGRTATAITTGNFFSCVRLDDASVKCWGNGPHLGLGTINNRGDGPNELGDNLPAVDLGAGRTVVALSTGALYTCATLDNGALKCWGNGGPWLGQGDFAARGNNPGEMGDNLPAVFLPPAGFMSGTITETGTGVPLAGVSVIALRTSDFGTAGSAVTDSNGDYLMQASTGTYYLYLAPPAGAHTDGFLGAPTLVTVTDGATTDTDGTMTTKRGGFSGTVTDQATGSGTPIPGATVIAIGPSGITASATTAANGTYTISGLPPGAYRAAFVDGLGRRVTEYWNNSPDYAGGSIINVTAGTTTPGINAALFRP